MLLGIKILNGMTPSVLFTGCRNLLYIYIYIYIYICVCVCVCVCVCMGARGGLVVKELRYKPAGRGFDSRWYHWSFSVT